MRIFICFAAEQRSVAEDLAMTLRTRGHAVFFSKDTLPIAEEFHERIQKAVDAADLLIYLISPEAVERGNYTLTELSYARKKWPNPSGRVLPVMATPTTMSKIPSYLTNVGILDPDGNIAAETAAQVDSLVKKLRPRQMYFPLIGGVASGALSYIAVKFFNDFLQLKFINGESMTAIPGLLFGILMAMINVKCGFRDRVGLACIVVVTACTWVLAEQTAGIVGNSLEKYQHTTYVSPSTATANSDTGHAEEGPAERKERLPVIWGLAGLVGGLIGGVGTVVGIAVVNKRLRDIQNVFMIVATATTFGSLLETVNFSPDLGYIVLFVTWQTVVSILVARSLSNSKNEVDDFDFRSIWQH